MRGREKNTWSRNRTGTPLQALDFESNASTNSAIQAHFKQRTKGRVYQATNSFSIRDKRSNRLGKECLLPGYCCVASILAKIELWEMQ